MVNIFKNKIARAFKSFDIFIFQFFPPKSQFHGQDQTETTFYAYHLKDYPFLHNSTKFHFEIQNRIETVNNTKMSPSPARTDPLNFGSGVTL